MGLLGVQDFLLEGVGLGESNSNFVSSELRIDLSQGFQFVFNLLFVEGVDRELDVLLSVKGHLG